MNRQDEHLLTVGGQVWSSGQDPKPGADDGSWWLSVDGESLTTGRSEPIERTIVTLLQDGAKVVSEGSTNREAAMRLTVHGMDSRGLAEAEAELWSLAGKPCEMTWKAADGFSATSVFEVFTVHLSPITDDFAETHLQERTYAVRLVCHPTVRSVDSITTSTALSPTGEAPVNVQISAGDSLTGWSDFASVPILDGGDFLYYNSGTVYPKPIFTPAAPVDLTKTRYVSMRMVTHIDYSPGPGTYTSMTAETPFALINGIRAKFAAATYYAPGDSGNLFARYYYEVPESITSGTSFRMSPAVNPAANYRFEFNDLRRTDTLPASGTPRQKMVRLGVEGSAPAHGDLRVESPTTALGPTLVYSWPDGAQRYAPSITEYTAGGGFLEAPATVSGKESSLSAEDYYSIPAANLSRGSHQWVIRAKNATAGTHVVNWTAQVRPAGSGTAIGRVLTGSTPITFVADNTYQYAVITTQMLPNVLLPENTTAAVHLTLVADDIGAEITTDGGGWLFNLTIGRLSWVEAGTGAPAAAGPSSRLWLDAAKFPDRDRPTISRGTLADRSDSFYAGSAIVASGRHEFSPGLANVLTVTPGATDAVTTLAYHARWGSHAGS